MKDRPRRTAPAPRGAVSARELLKSFEGKDFKPAPVCLITGENAWFRDLILAKLKEMTVPDGWQSSNVDTIRAEETPEGEVADLARTPPFGSSKRIVIARGIEAWRKARARDRDENGDEEDDKSRGKRLRMLTTEDSSLAVYARDPSPSSVLVMTAGRGDSWDKDCLGKAALGSGAFVVCEALEGRDLESWVEKEAGGLKIGIEPAAVSELIMRTPEDCLSLRRELEKLAVYAGEGKTVTVDDVTALSGELAVPSIFEFLNALFVERAPGRALSLLGRLLEETHPLYLHAMMLMQVRKLVSLREAVARNLPQGQLAGMFRVPYSLVPRVSKVAAATSGARFAAFLQQLAEAEARLKRIHARGNLERFREGREVMETLVIEFCA